MNTSKIPEITIAVSFDKNVKKSELLKIDDSKSCADVFRQIFDADRFDWVEEFMILCLNQNRKVVGFHKISSGGMTGTVADPKVILTVALKSLATGIVLAHNHPSGNLMPSQADIQLTQKIKTAASYLDIKVLDHLILSSEGYYSFADEGQI